MSEVIAIIELIAEQHSDFVECYSDELDFLLAAPCHCFLNLSSLEHDDYGRSANIET